MQHISVLPAETMEALQLRSGDSVIDATAGMGGHSRLLSAAVGPSGHVYACDTDPESLVMAEANCAGSGSPITFLHTPFSRLQETLQAAKVGDRKSVV